MIHQRIDRRISACLLAMALAMLSVGAAVAATFEGGEEPIVAAGETIDDNLYMAGNIMRIEGTVDGDLICAGTRVEVTESGRVTGDLICGAQSIVVDGRVDGDVRSAGFTLRVGPQGQVGGEFIAAGFSVALDPGAAVEDDLIMAAAQGLIDGAVGGDLRFAGAGLDLQGSVAGDVDAEVGGPGEGSLEQGTMWTSFVPAEQRPDMPERYAAPGLTIGADAVIGGDLRYRGPPAAEIDADASGAVAGSTEFSAIEVQQGTEREVEEPSSPILAWLWRFLRRFVALAVIGLILLWLAPRLLSATGTELGRNSLPSAGWGLLTLLLAVAGLLALGLGTLFGLILLGMLRMGDLVTPMLAAVGLILAFLTAGLHLFGWAGRVAVGDWIGQRLLARARTDSAAWLTMLAGLAVLAILTTLPIVGGLIDFLVMLLGLGALMVHLWRSLRPESMIDAAGPLEAEPAD